MRLFSPAKPRPLASPILARRARGFAIPRTIHQTYSSDEIPDAFAPGIARLRAINRGWSYRYWPDKEVHDFIYAVYGWEVLRAFLRINPRYGAARADLFRYLCIYHFGGVYLDIKSGGSVDLDSVIAPEDAYLLSQWRNAARGHYPGWGLHPELAHVPGGEYQNWFIIAAAGHPFLERVILTVLANLANYREERDGTGRMAVLRITGPIAYTRAIHPLLAGHEHRFFDAEAAGLRYCTMRNHLRIFGAESYMRQTTPLVL
jgi:mannosyltransferase OCH1-like enzyme